MVAAAAPSAVGSERPRTECLFPRLAAPSSPVQNTPKGARGGRDAANPSSPPLRRARSEASLLGARGARLAYGARVGVEPPARSELSAATTVLSAVSTDFWPEHPLSSIAPAAPAAGAVGSSALSVAAPSVAAPATPVPLPEEEESPKRPRLPPRRRSSGGIPAGAADVPYPMSSVSSAMSAWMQEYYEEPGHAFTRGLRTQDPRNFTECSICTCTVGQPDLPKMPAGRGEEQKLRNIEYINRQLKAMGAQLPKASDGIPSGPGGRVAPCAVVARSRYQTYVLEKPRS